MYHKQDGIVHEVVVKDRQRNPNVFLSDHSISNTSLSSSGQVDYYCAK